MGHFYIYVYWNCYQILHITWQHSCYVMYTEISIKFGLQWKKSVKWTPDMSLALSLAHSVSLTLSLSCSVYLYLCLWFVSLRLSIFVYCNGAAFLHSGFSVGQLTLTVISALVLILVMAPVTIRKKNNQSDGPPVWYLCQKLVNKCRPDLGYHTT